METNINYTCVSDEITDSVCQHDECVHRYTKLITQEAESCGMNVDAFALIIHRSIRRSRLIEGREFEAVIEGYVRGNVKVDADVVLALSSVMRTIKPLYTIEANAMVVRKVDVYEEAAADSAACTLAGFSD